MPWADLISGWPSVTSSLVWKCKCACTTQIHSKASSTDHHSHLKKARTYLFELSDVCRPVHALPFDSVASLIEQALDKLKMDIILEGIPNASSALDGWDRIDKCMSAEDLAKAAGRERSGGRTSTGTVAAKA